MAERDGSANNGRASKSTARRDDDTSTGHGDDARKRSEHRSERSNGQRGGSTRSPSPMQLARYAAQQLAELVGREPEGVVSLKRTDDGWCIGVEVVETRRIPDTADILAEYAVDVDQSGDLVGYRRTRRYSRGRAQEDS